MLPFNIKKFILINALFAALPIPSFGCEAIDEDNLEIQRSNEMQLQESMRMQDLIQAKIGECKSKAKQQTASGAAQAEGQGYGAIKEARKINEGLAVILAKCAVEVSGLRMDLDQWIAGNLGPHAKGLKEIAAEDAEAWEQENDCNPSLENTARLADYAGKFLEETTRFYESSGVEEENFGKIGGEMDRLKGMGAERVAKAESRNVYLRFRPATKAAVRKEAAQPKPRTVKEGQKRTTSSITGIDESERKRQQSDQWILDLVAGQAEQK